VLFAGGVVVPLDPAESASRTTFAIGTAATLGPAAHVVDWADVLAEESTRPAREGSAAGCDRAALLLSSSGTMGVPKQVVLTHRNLAANLAQIHLVHRLTARDVVLGLTPFRHIYGMQMAMNPTLRAGGTLVTVPTPFSATDLLDVVERRRITVAYLVPSVLAELARHNNASRDTSSLRLVFSGGAPLPPAVAKACTELLKVPVVQGYGMTEAGCTCAPPDGRSPTPGSIGLPLPGTDTRFVDPDTGMDAAAEASGEIWVRGPQVSPGYLESPDTLVPLVDADGWLHTGDIGRRDARGYVTITGRLKQLIKYKGHQVAPAELEAILLTHPNVRDAVVVGVPDDVAGEIPKAFVVLDAAIALDEVTAYVAARVAPYQKIRQIKAVDRIPRTATGKVIRAADGGLG
jgi:acyl-CoA synthetase (AMP-forming)/AMP-acid ligase II